VYFACSIMLVVGWGLMAAWPVELSVGPVVTTVQPRKKLVDIDSYLL
jgi:hypothetical protein